MILCVRQMIINYTMKLLSLWDNEGGSSGRVCGALGEGRGGTQAVPPQLAIISGQRPSLKLELYWR